MFGLNKAPSDDAARRAQEIERARFAVINYLQKLRSATPEEAERLTESLKSYIQGDKILPMDFKKDAQNKAKELERNANMRVCDALVHEAAQAAAAEKPKARSAKLTDSRKYFSKACTLGATAEWRKAYQRSTETIMMTGGVQHEGPTRAKPADLVPKTPNRAKA